MSYWPSSNYMAPDDLARKKPGHQYPWNWPNLFRKSGTNEKTMYQHVASIGILIKVD